MKLLNIGCVPHYPENLGGWTMNIEYKEYKRPSVWEILISICQIMISIDEALYSIEPVME